MIIDHVQNKKQVGYVELEGLAEMQNWLELSSDDTEYLAALSAEARQSLQVLLSFWHADWPLRLRMLKEHEALLLGESVESLFVPFQEVLAKDTEAPATARQSAERLRALLHYCRAWDIESGWFFAAYMLLEDNIDVPAQYKDKIHKIVLLLSQQKEDTVAQAIAIMQTMLDRLTADTPILFEAALLCDLATEQASLPRDHPARVPEQIVAYYREALPHYQAAGRLYTVAFIQRLLATILCEQGYYNDALKLLQAATQTLQTNKSCKHDAAGTFSEYADTLYRVGRLEESLEAYDQALALLPDESALFYNRAEKRILTRRLDEARADLEQALTLDGNEDNPHIWLCRAQLAIAQGDGFLGEQMLQEALKQDAHFAAPLLYVQCAWLRGEVHAACEKLQNMRRMANVAEREVIRREIVRLLNEHPDLPGSDEVVAILIGLT